MINKSKEVAKYIFYIGIVITASFGAGTITYFLGVEENSASHFAIMILGVLPTVIGLLMILMGNHMQQKNKRYRSPRKHED